MKSAPVHIGERIRGAIELADLEQQEVATAMKRDPNVVSRLLAQAEIDGWTGFLLGVAYINSINKKQVRQVAQR